MERFEAIVVGIGGMGSAALFHLARRGVGVLGIEPNGIAHDRGSSHGQTRIIRKAYFEHPAYVPLVERSYTGWAELEALSGEQLLQQTGLLTVGRADSDVIEGTLRSAGEHSLAIESLNPDDLQRRFPMFRANEEMIGLWEEDAGFLHVEACVRTYIEQATACGATLALGEAVESWKSTEAGVTVTTQSGRYGADRLILCAGPWTTGLIPGSHLLIEVRRKVMLWFDAPDERFHVGHGFPVFCFDTPGGFFYGFPALANGLLKVGEHSGGQPLPDPDQIDRSLRPEDQTPVVEFLREHVPDVGPEVRAHSVCMYSMTPDEHFIVDFVPDTPNVIVAAGFSGHGFKFAPVIGSVLADLAQQGRTDESVDFLSAARRFPGASHT